MIFKWADVAFSSKKPLKELHATFIAAPRDISVKRFTEIVKEYLPQGNIVVGISTEEYVIGFEDQPQFKMLAASTIQPVIDKVAASKSPYKIHLLEYSQRDLKYIFEKVSFAQVLLVNGSWKYSFHTQAPYYSLVQAGIPYAYIPAFTDEDEARAYEESLAPKLLSPTAKIGKAYTESELLQAAMEAARSSYDHSFQTGAVLAHKQGPKYTFKAWAYNKVVPYQTYAMLNGAARELHFSPANDLNHYDTVHAETMLILEAARNKIDLEGDTVFINLLPCPTCARMLSQTPIAEIVYSEDHSDGYAVKLLETSGKKVRRLVL